MARAPIDPANVPITEDAVRASIEAEAAAEAEADAERKRKAEEAALLKRWGDRLKHAREHDADARKDYARDRKYAQGDTDWLVDTNLIGAIIEILMAFIYAKDPDVSVRPSDAVGVARMQTMAQVAKTLEVVLSRLLKNAGLKRQALRWVRSAMTIGIGWLKVHMQTRMEIDPVMEQRINDLRENLKMLSVAQADLAAGDCGDVDLKRAEIEQQIAACEAKLEREIAEGAIIDFVAGEDVQVAPECGELENYLNAPWISFDTYKSREEAQALTDWPDTEEYRDKIRTANLYVERPRKGDQQTGGQAVPSGQKYMQVTAAGESEAMFGFVKIVEIWSRTDGRVFTMIEGCDCWARQPYTPRTGMRFYPGFQLAFHYHDSLRHPQSDVHQLRKLQDEYGRTRSNFAEHRRRAIAAILFDKTVIDEKSMTAINTSTTSEFIGIETTNGQPLGSAFLPKPYAPVDPGLYTTDPIRIDMEKVSGAQDAQQGSVAVEKTLGEAEIQQSGFLARTGTRKDAVEGALSEVTEYLAQLALQVMDESTAIQLAGPEAVWPQLTVEECLTLFSVEIKAGSTGKPRNNMDKQTWGTLLPLLQQMIEKIGAMRMQGQEWAAKPWIALLRETAHRLDDRIDVDALLPVVPAQMLAAVTGGAGGNAGPQMAGALGAAVPSPEVPDPALAGP